MIIRDCSRRVGHPSSILNFIIVLIVAVLQITLLVKISNSEYLKFSSLADVRPDVRLPVVSSKEKSSNSSRQFCKFAYKAINHKNLYTKCHACLSQGVQDHILTRIFNTVGTTNQHCVEFGFGYGKGTSDLTMDMFSAKKKITSGLNTHMLIQHGWNHTFFDAIDENEEINLVKAVLSEDNIVLEFQKAGIPANVDYVSIDVDSTDIWLLNGLLKGGHYKPRVISIEYNQNWPASMPVTCSKIWEPWRRRSRIYGTSAAAVHIVAQMHNYTIVEMMHDLDIFLVHNDVLGDTCNNTNELPAWEWLGDGYLGTNVHRTCDEGEAMRRLVDFPLAFEGKTKEASAKAMEYIHELNEYRVQRGEPEFCNMSTSTVLG